MISDLTEVFYMTCGNCRAETKHTRESTEDESEPWVCEECGEERE